MKENKIALLVDVDNVKISGAAFTELYDELNKRGDVVYCKFYGYNDRKHIYLSDFIAKYGYETAPFMRFKKRFSQLDNRMLVDAVKLNYTKPEINTYCIVAGDGDLIPLLVELKSSGKHLIDINTSFYETNTHMFDEHIVVPSINKEAEVYTSKISKLPKLKPIKVAPKLKEEPKKEESAKVSKPEVNATKTSEPVKEPEVEEMDDELDDDLDYNLSNALRSITARYNELDFSDSSEMAKKLKLIKDIEELISTENTKGEGVYSANADVRQIFTDLQDVVDDMKNAL